jgi:hypothetical protein
MGDGRWKIGDGNDDGTTRPRDNKTTGRQDRGLVVSGQLSGSPSHVVSGQWSGGHDLDRHSLIHSRGPRSYF